ncbi:hypothetical protein E3P84_00441 [Wallemia ichthyophaga]|nr:hypothetical protein E3P84_00441 [Wallemia ichthyophaga]TIB43854.1 hypothetical protein E3P83_00584 [Wallemia ichthyophaga]
MDHYSNPRNVGSLNKNDMDVGTGVVGAPACGDVMKLQIMVDDKGLISDVKFKTFGCGSAIASSSFMTERVRGLTLDEAGAIKNTDIARELSLPPVKLHCSMLAEDAIRSAIRNYKSKAQERGGSFTGSIDVAQSSMSQATESMSLEDTNAMRVKLGLKPIQDDNSSQNNEKSAESNYATLKADEQKERESEEQRVNIERTRNKLQLNKRLKGKTLGEDTGEDDAKKWAKRLKRKQKEAAERVARAQLEQDNLYTQDDSNYNESHLSGLRVGHNVDDFAEGKDHILTLKDGAVLDDADDELQNLDLAEDERGRERAELSKGVKARQYTGLDDEEFGADGAAKKPALLSKYDEELAGADSGFRLGDATAHTSKNTTDNHDNSTLTQPTEKLNKTLLSLDYLKNEQPSDFLKDGDVGFKKSKTKKTKKRSTRKAEVVDGDMQIDTSTSTHVEMKPPAPRERANLEHTNMIDDDDLQIALAKQRRDKQRRSKAVRQKKPEEIAAEIGELDEIDMRRNGEETEKEVDGKAKSLVLDDTSEFIRTVQMAPQQEAQEVHESVSVKKEPDLSVDGDQPLDVAADMDVTIEDVDGIKKEEEKGEQSYQGDGGFEKESTANTPTNPPTHTTHAKGLGSLLASLKQQGQIEALTPEQRERERVQSESLHFLADQRAREVVREEHRQRIRLDETKSQQDRDRELRSRDARSAQEDKEAFERNYKPSVDIKYHDETGRAQTAKEAWKYLNYKFHGRGQGTKGQEKKLRQIEMERRQMAMTSGETPLNVMGAFQSRREATGSAHMVLSVGNRGAAPQSDSLFDAGSRLEKRSGGSGNAVESVGNRAGDDATASTSTSTLAPPEDTQHTQANGTSSFVPVGSSSAPEQQEQPAKSTFAPIGSLGASTSTGTGAGAQAGGLKLGGKITFGKRKSDTGEIKQQNKQPRLD